MYSWEEIVLNYRSRNILTSGLLAAVVLCAAGAGTRLAAPQGAVAADTTTLRIGYTTTLGTFDPAQSYTDDWWLMNGTVFNGLYLFDRNGKPQLNMAAAPPVVSANRLTWTFKINPSVRFSNGTPVTASDFKYAVLRTLNPHLKPAASWAQSFDTVFAGAADYIAGKAKDVSGVQVVDAHTIRYVLASPFDLLPNLLATTFNSPVPAALYARESADYIQAHPIGAGPYMLQSWQRGSQAVFVKNPYYFRKDKPKIAKIIAYEQMPSNVITLKIQKGELDGFGNDQDIAAPDLHAIQNDPHYASYLTQGQPVDTVFLDLNTKVAPLDNLKLRQAIATAINRQRLVKLLGGNAIAAYQLFIPLDPEFDTTLATQSVYPYDPAKARQLVKDSGYNGQSITLLYGNDQSYFANQVAGIQQALQQVGINVTLRGASATSVLALGGPLTGHQASLGTWSVDYPDGYDIYGGVMSCGSNQVGGTIAAHYCDQAADDLFDQSTALPLGATRTDLLRKAQIKNLQDAAHIPLVFIKSIEIVSPRVKNFYYAPTYGWQFQDYSL